MTKNATAAFFVCHTMMPMTQRFHATAAVSGSYLDPAARRDRHDPGTRDFADLGLRPARSSP